MTKAPKMPTSVGPSEQKRVPASPRRVIPWAMALSCTLFVAGGLLLAEKIAAVWEYASLQQQVSSDFAGSTPVAYILGNKRYQPIFSSPGNVSRYYLPIASFLEQNDFQRATKLLQGAPFARSQQAQDLQNAIESMMTVRAKRARLEQELEELQTANEQNFRSYDQLRFQLTEMLGYTAMMADTATPEAETAELEDGDGTESYEVATADAETTEEDNEADEEDGEAHEKMQFYEAGLLQNLPVVEGIPDNIVDGKQLRLYARKDEQDSAHSPLGPEQLRHLRDLGANLASSVDFNLEKEVRLNRELTGALEEEQTAVQAARETFSALLFNDPSDKLGPFAVQAYEQFQAVLSPLGLPVPGLKV